MDNHIVIALDVDDFLTCMDADCVSRKGAMDPVHQLPRSFVTAEFEHEGHPYKVLNFLTPGSLEFFRFLFSLDRVKPAFFSAGLRVRNVDLGRRIIQAVSACDGSGRDGEWLDRYDVFSREDCFDTVRMDWALQHLGMSRDLRDSMFQPKEFYGNIKKDLRMIRHGREKYHELYQAALQTPQVLAPDPERDKPFLENVILVEEDSSYLFPGQEKHMLLCPTYRQSHPCLANHRGEDLPKVQDSFSDTFKTTNTIFYAAGILRRAFDRMRAEGLSLPELLWQEQGRLWFDRRGDREKRFPLEFFSLGRETLRRFNPNLNFAVPAA